MGSALRHQVEQGGEVRRFGVIAELFRMMWERKTWILIPPVVALILVGALIVLGTATPLGPLVYTLF